MPSNLKRFAFSNSSIPLSPGKCSLKHMTLLFGKFFLSSSLRFTRATAEDFYHTATSNRKHNSEDLYVLDYANL
jgi:hypothetical protein